MSNKRRKVMLPPMCHCIICYEDMGEQNPRQYCSKWHCPFEDADAIIRQIRSDNLKASSYYEKPLYKKAIDDYIAETLRLEKEIRTKYLRDVSLILYRLLPNDIGFIVKSFL